MKKRTFQLILILLLCAFLQISTSLGIDAASNVSSLDIQVDHAFEIQNGGLVILKENFKLTNKLGENTVLLQNFTTGFPSEYGSNLDYCFAYGGDLNEQLEVKLDVGLGKIGFYGVKAIFPNSGVQISVNKSYSFTVVFLFQVLYR